MKHKDYIDFILFLKERETFTEKEKEYINIAFWLLEWNQIDEVRKIWKVDRIIIKMLRDYIYNWITPINENSLLAWI